MDSFLLAFRPLLLDLDLDLAFGFGFRLGTFVFAEPFKVETAVFVGTFKLLSNNRSQQPRGHALDLARLQETDTCQLKSTCMTDIRRG